MRASWCRWEGDNLFLQVRIQPKASRDELVGVHDECLKVRITAPPVDGRANAHLVGFLAKQFGVSKSRVALIKGQTSKTKTLRIVAPAKLPEAIQQAL